VGPADLSDPVPGPIIVGNTWAGLFPNEPSYGSEGGDMAMQLVDIDDNGNYYLVGSYNLNGPTNGACIIQAYWSGSVDDTGDWDFVPVTDGDGNDVFFQQCQFGSPFSPVEFFATFSPDDSTLTIYGSPDNIILYRDPQ